MKNFIYPESDKLTICKTDLVHKLKDYREAIGNKLSFSDLLILVPAWASILSLRFPDISSSEKVIIPGLVLKATAAALLTMGTVPKLRPLFTFWRKPGNPNGKCECDPEKKVDSIFGDCIDNTSKK